MPPRSSLRTSTFSLALMVLAATLAPLVAAEPEPAPAAAEPQPAPLDDVLTKRDLAYYEGPGADPVKHKLDLFLPRDKRDFPVLFFVHGGAWVIGDKADFGIYAALGRMLARHGIGTVSINYRLTPQVQHPEHVKDAARAFAWTHKHIGEYGGRADRIFVCGHSAGGHLVALLATDESRLAAEGLSLADIRGAIPMSGIYRLRPHLLKTIFTDDPEVRQSAEPINLVTDKSPPFLIIYGDHDFPQCDVASEAFAARLREKHVESSTLSVADRTHISLMTHASRDDDPAAVAIRDFIARHSK